MTDKLMSDERCKVIAAHLEQHGMLPEEYAEELLAETNALHAELTAARSVEDVEVASKIDQLRALGKARLSPWPLDSAVVFMAAELLTRLSAAKAEAERERDEVRAKAIPSGPSVMISPERYAALVAAEAALEAAERERDSARADALEEAAQCCDRMAKFLGQIKGAAPEDIAAMIRALKPTPTTDM